MTPCPDSSKLLAILGNHAVTDETVELHRHLDECVACQRTLEELAADRGIWEETKSGLEESLRREPALRRVVEKLKGEDAPQLEPDDLSFLQPSSEPGLLGLLNQYQVQAVIGRGATGLVLRAWDPALNRLVAIKVLATRLATSARARERFLREGQAAAAICHDHVITVYAVSEINGLPYLVMQHISESVQDRLDRGESFELAEIVRIGKETASGLAAAHARGLIHRDIKPANLLLEAERDRVKITDFGLAWMPDSTQLTGEGVVTGTPEYMAPEQARGQRVDQRADLFSLGSVLFAITTGTAPFHGSSAVAVLRQVSDETPAPLRDLKPAIPEWFEEIVDRMMAKDPDERVQSAAEIAALLEAYHLYLKEPEKRPKPELPPRRSGIGRNGKKGAQTSHAQNRVVLFAFISLIIATVGILAWFPSVDETSALDNIFRESADNLPTLFDIDFRQQSFAGNAQLINAGKPEFVQSGPEGLDLKVPKTFGIPFPGKGLGIETWYGLRGDFDFSVSFDNFEAESPTRGRGAGLDLAVYSMSAGSAVISRIVRADKLHGISWNRWRMKEEGFVPHWEPSGRLRLKREGTALYFLWATGLAGGDFEIINQCEFGDSDIKFLSAALSSGGVPCGVAARLLQWRLRGEKEMNPAAGSAGVPQNAPVNGQKIWPLKAFLLATIMALILALGLWLVLSRIRQQSKFSR